MTTTPGTSLELLHAVAERLAAKGPVEIGTMGTRTLHEWAEIPAHADHDTTLDTWTALATESLH